jgi:hypothetical protein
MLLAMTVGDLRIRLRDARKRVALGFMESVV